MRYSEEFNNAVRRTKSYGLSSSGCDGLLEGEILFYDVSALNALMKSAYKKRYRELTIKDVLGQCAAMSLKYADALYNVHGIETYITIGNVYMSDGYQFAIEEKEYIDLLDKTVRGRRAFNFHVWLTLPSGVIVDPTIATTVTVMLSNKAPDPWRICVGHHDEFPGIRYQPMFVGVDYLDEIGVSSCKGIHLISRVINNIARKLFG